MKITLITIGKTNETYLKEGMAIFQKRLTKYITFDIIEIPDLKGKFDVITQKRKEGEEILKIVGKGDQLILLDEGGKQYTSVEYSEFIQKQMNLGLKHIYFAVGGPYGFSEELYKKSTSKISFSKMTFSHQMVRLFFVEQLYRAYSILGGEPYHNG